MRQAWLVSTTLSHLGIFRDRGMATFKFLARCSSLILQEVFAQRRYLSVGGAEAAAVLQNSARHSLTGRRLHPVRVTVDERHRDLHHLLTQQNAIGQLFQDLWCTPRVSPKYTYKMVQHHKACLTTNSGHDNKDQQSRQAIEGMVGRE